MQISPLLLQENLKKDIIQKLHLEYCYLIEYKFFLF